MSVKDAHELVERSHSVSFGDVGDGVRRGIRRFVGIDGIEVVVAGESFGKEDEWRLVATGEAGGISWCLHAKTSEEL